MSTSLTVDEVRRQLADAETECDELRDQLASERSERTDYEYEGRHTAYAIAIGLLQDVRRGLLTLGEYERALEDAD